MSDWGRRPRTRSSYIRGKCTGMQKSRGEDPGEVSGGMSVSHVI